MDIAFEDLSRFIVRYKLPYRRFSAYQKPIYDIRKSSILFLVAIQEEEMENRKHASKYIGRETNAEDGAKV